MRILHNSKKEDKKNASSGQDSQGDSIKVYVRVRPPDASHFTNPENIDQNLCLEVSSPTSILLQCKPEPKTFTYDHVADINTTQEEVFGAVGKRIVEGCVEGYNGTIFAYGQTGSGKTFTMLGPSEDESFTHELRGIIPRSFEYLFSLINREKEKQGDKLDFLCRCSFLEIYNEQIFDLLDAASVGLHLREDIKRGVFVDGLQEKDVSSAKDAYDVLNSGWLNRRVASTSMNRESSRSHAVFTVNIQSKEKKGGVNNIKLSQLHLVDLAGSERQRDTHAEGVRLKEAASINRSLSALGNVIMALVDITHGKQRHVHYRDSKLTFLLRDSLGGNARTYIIGNVHPSAKCFGETLSTLQFTRRAKMIKNKAVLNEDSTGSITSLQAEIKRLRSELEQARAGMTMQISSQGSSTEEGSTNVSTRHCTCGSTTATTSPDSNNNAGAVDMDKYKEWKEMMVNAISTRDRAEQEKQVLSEKIQKLEELCSKKEKFLQSTKMILKFRENHISKLESKLQNKQSKINGEDCSERDKEMQLLQDEIKLLKDKIEHHPDVTRFAMENLELRAELKRLRNLDPVNNDLAADLARSHRYTLQLEKQLRDYMQSPQGSELEKSLSSSIQSLEASTAELEKSKHEINQLQSQMENLKLERDESREEQQQAKEKQVELEEVFRKKQLHYESELAGNKKTITELERSLEALQLKTAVERTTLNDIHMQTIRTLATPKKMTPNKLNTPKGSPLRGLNRTPPSGRLNSPIINLSDEKPPIGMLKRKDSFNDSGSDSEFDEPLFNFDSDSKDAEELYAEALADELKKLQDMNDSLRQQLQNDEATRIKLSQVNSKLEFQVTHLQDYINTERDKWAARETELDLKVHSLTEQLKETKGELSVIRSENEDLKIILQAADRKMDSLKKEKDLESIDTGRKIAALEGKLVRLEIDHHNQQSEMESTIELNQQLQADNETLREELEFKSYKIEEYESLVTSEREKIKNLEQDLQAAIEKLEIQTETNIKLLAQADKEQELVSALEQCAALRTELQDTNILSEQQGNKIKSLTRELDMTKSSLSLINKQNASDKEYMNGLRKSVQELKVNVTEKEGEVASLNSQLEEIKSQQQDLLDALEEKKAQVTKQKDKLKVEAEKSASEREEYESRLASLQEELRHTANQCRELTMALEQEQNQMASFQALIKTKEEGIQQLEAQLCEKQDALNTNKEQYESRIAELQNLAESNDQILFIESQASELEEHKAKNAQFSRLLQELELSQQEKNKELADCREKVHELDQLVHKNEILQTELKRLQYELEIQQVEAREREVVKEFELQQMKDQANKSFESCVKANTEKEASIIERKRLENELSTVTAKLEVALDDANEMSEELERIRSIEERVFCEKEDLKSQIETMNEEKLRYLKDIRELEKRNTALTCEMANVSGHCNSKQKIQMHEKLKKEINDITKENRELKLELARLNQDTIKEPRSKICTSTSSVLNSKAHVHNGSVKRKHDDSEDDAEDKENYKTHPVSS